VHIIAANDAAISGSDTGHADRGAEKPRSYGLLAYANFISPAEKCQATTSFSHRLGNLMGLGDLP
jgi:hypothetical protein